jgi:hypothetical protein
VFSTPSSARNVALLMDPPAVNGAENRLLPDVGLGLEKTPRKPVPVPAAMAAVVTAGNWFRMEAGTVKVPGPAVVIQPKVAMPVEVDPEEPIISTKSVELPPVQFRVRPEFRVTEEGSPPVIVSRVPRVREALNGPTSLPPAPFRV